MKGDIIMKFAILTDVHGNFDALDTVLDDID
ncbi:metallophosphoesterase, partial [Staphylococcus cohnii]